MFGIPRVAGGIALLAASPVVARDDQQYAPEGRTGEHATSCRYPEVASRQRTPGRWRREGTGRRISTAGGDDAALGRERLIEPAPQPAGDRVADDFGRRPGSLMTLAVVRHIEGAGMNPQQVAEAFSAHRFEETNDQLADDVRWVLPGQATIEGKPAVLAACADSLAEFAALAATSFDRFVSVGSHSVAAVDAIGRYVGTDGSTSVVSSADIYQFDTRGRVVQITSYAVELDG